MKNFYIPTSSLNFNNILSSESISPKAFYSARSFGYGRWTSIPENPYENSIVLYDQLCGFNRPASDYEDHPMVIEISLDEAVYSTFIEAGEHAYLCDHSIYIDPFSSSIFFFTEKDRRIVLSMSDASIETKFVQLYNKKIVVVTPPLQRFPAIDATAEKQELNMAEIEKDKRTNRMKGLLYGYYIGAILSTSQDQVAKLNNAREIHNILAAILASFDHKATEQQRERLKTLYATFQPPVPFLSKLSALVVEKSLYEAIVSLVRGEYGYIRGEFNVDRTLAQLLAAPVSPDAKNPVVENINAIIKHIESDMSKNAHLLSVDESQIVVIDGVLTHLNIEGISDHDKKLCLAWVNDVLSKDDYNGKVSTFKDTLSDDVTRKAKEVCDGEWKGSYPEITLNALRRHVRGDEFPHSWNNDIYSSMSAVVVRGDDWQKMLQYMQSKMMTDYRIAFAFYSTLNGFANLPRDFTDVLFVRERKYIADVYKEFYGQLFGRSVISSKSEVAETVTEVPTPLVEMEDMPDFENEGKANTQTPTTITPSESPSSQFVEVNHKGNEPKLIEGFDLLIADICKKCVSAKKDEKRYLEFYARYGGATKEFVEAVSDEKVFGKKIPQGVKLVLAKKIKSSSGEKHPVVSQPMVSEQPRSLFENSYQSTGNFLSDYDFLANSTEFSSLMAGMNKKWLEDLQWFIDAHNPQGKDYSFYKGKPMDNSTIVRQFINFKNGKYRITESFLRKTYNI